MKRILEADDAKHLKFVTGHSEALKNLYNDVLKNNCICYDVQDFPVSSLSGFYPKAYLDKCSSVTVAISGDANDRDWMVIMPFRVDSQQDGRKVHDLDPFIVAFDANCGTPALTGVVAYHQNFDGRTSSVSGYEELSKPQTVSALRKTLKSGNYPISGAQPEIHKALEHMAKVFDKYL